MPVSSQVPDSHDGVSRFNHPECSETRTWEELARTYKDIPHMFSTGYLGSVKSADFQVWACFVGHPCLHKVAASSYTDAMCYKYHEREKTWYPWMLMSERDVYERRP